jgi:hypothetical protein
MVFTHIFIEPWIVDNIEIDSTVTMSFISTDTPLWRKIEALALCRASCA